jgi:hypothetical protein
LATLRCCGCCDEPGCCPSTSIGVTMDADVPSARSALEIKEIVFFYLKKFYMYSIICRVYLFIYNKLDNKQLGAKATSSKAFQSLSISNSGSLLTKFIEHLGKSIETLTSEKKKLIDYLRPWPCFYLFN